MPFSDVCNFSKQKQNCFIALDHFKFPWVLDQEVWHLVFCNKKISCKYSRSKLCIDKSLFITPLSEFMAPFSLRYTNITNIHFSKRKTLQTKVSSFPLWCHEFNNGKLHPKMTHFCFVLALPNIHISLRNILKSLTALFQYSIYNSNEPRTTYLILMLLFLLLFY